ncbi:MAG TPA: hypothetical protein VF941_07605, partial [Clostridia bacterium]
QCKMYIAKYINRFNNTKASVSSVAKTSRGFFSPTVKNQLKLQSLISDNITLPIIESNTVNFFAFFFNNRKSILIISRLRIQAFKNRSPLVT